MRPAWRGPVTFALTLLGLGIGLWWSAPVAGLVAGAAARRGGRPFLDAALGALLAWAALDAWRVLFWRGYAQAEAVAAVAGLPGAAGAAFLLLPALVAALAAGGAAAAASAARAAAERGARGAA
ncbi:MAG: hypothetical protein IMW98_06015 [Firmicutes bacterium]|nr:hypothetical protein [Bacillota bacterium]